MLGIVGLPGQKESSGLVVNPHAQREWGEACCPQAPCTPARTHVARHPYPAMKDSSSSQHALHCRHFLLSPRSQKSQIALGNILELGKYRKYPELGNGHRSHVHSTNIPLWGSLLLHVPALPLSPCLLPLLHFLYDSDLVAKRTSPHLMGRALPFGSGALQGLLLIGSVLSHRFAAFTPGPELSASARVDLGCSQSPEAWSKGLGLCPFASSDSTLSAVSPMKGIQASHLLSSAWPPVEEELHFQAGF